MNHTIDSFINNDGFSYVTLSGWLLFAVSEILPFIKRNDKGNGMIHSAVCLLRGSKCMIDGALDAIDKPAEAVDESSTEESSVELFVVGVEEE